MKTFVKPFIWNGNIKIPASKSHWQRIVALAVASRQKIIASPVNPCEDVLTSFDLARQLDVEVEVSGNKVFLSPNKLQNRDTVTLHTGESGLSTRIFSIISTLFYSNIKIDGKGSLNRRKLLPSGDFLKAFGLIFDSNNGYLPVSIKGKLHHAETSLLFPGSSQWISGLLMALPFLEGKSQIKINSLKSRPYIDITLDILRKAGIQIYEPEKDLFVVHGYQPVLNCRFKVESDWSTAAFYIVGSACHGELIIEGISKSSSHADKKILEVLEQYGANVNWLNDDQLYVKSSDKSGSFDIDISDSPDLFPVICAMAVRASGPCRIYGIERLEHKESNRLATIMEEWNRLGLKIETEGNVAVVYPGNVKGGEFYSHNDHRLVMAGIILGSFSERGLWILGSDAVNKSYPQIWDDLSKFTTLEHKR